jgi:lipoyl(octanoyl) transferase
MAIDEHLLLRAAEGSVALRTYTWSAPTVSLGYFQAAASRPAHLRGLAYVRRQTGGGAILHDRELTYSLVLPAAHALAQLPTTALYDRVHACLSVALAEFGVRTQARGQCEDPALDGRKVVGSAQRRRTRAVLQHGSILLAASDHEPELPGVLELAGQRLDADALAGRVAVAVAEEFGVAWDDRPLDDAEQRDVARLLHTKYAASDWNDMR